VRVGASRTRSTRARANRALPGSAFAASPSPRRAPRSSRASIVARLDVSLSRARSSDARDARGAREARQRDASLGQFRRRCVRDERRRRGDSRVSRASALRDVEGEGDASAVDAQGVLVELKVRRRRRRRRKDDDLI